MGQRPQHHREEQVYYGMVLGARWLCRDLGSWQQLAIKCARSNKWVPETPSVDFCSSMANIYIVGLQLCLFKLCLIQPVMDTTMTMTAHGEMASWTSWTLRSWSTWCPAQLHLLWGTPGHMGGVLATCQDQNIQDDAGECVTVTAHGCDTVAACRCSIRQMRTLILRLLSALRLLNFRLNWRISSWRSWKSFFERKLYVILRANIPQGPNHW